MYSFDNLNLVTRHNFVESAKACARFSNVALSLLQEKFNAWNDGEGCIHLFIRAILIGSQTDKIGNFRFYRKHPTRPEDEVLSLLYVTARKRSGQRSENVDSWITASLRYFAIKRNMTIQNSTDSISNRLIVVIPFY